MIFASFLSFSSRKFQLGAIPATFVNFPKSSLEPPLYCHPLQPSVFASSAYCFPTVNLSNFCRGSAPALPLPAPAGEAGGPRGPCRPCRQEAPARAWRKESVISFLDVSKGYCRPDAREEKDKNLSFRYIR